MAIQYVTNALGASNSTTSFSITLPTTAAGDLLILEFTHRGTGNGTIAGTSVTTGGLTWTLKHSQLYATDTFSGKTYWTRATGNHSGQTVTGADLVNSCAALLTQYKGALKSGDPLADATIVGEANDSGDETQAAITTATNGAYVVLVVANSPDVAVTSMAAANLTLSARAERLSTGGTDTSIAHASGPLATAGSSGTFTWAQTNGAGGSWAYAITPEIEAGSGGGTLPVATASGEGTVTQPSLDGSGSGTLPAVTASGSGQVIFDFGWFPRSFTNGSPIVFDAWASRRGAWYADGASSLPALTASGAGTAGTAGTTWEGTGAATLPTLSATGAGTFWTTFSGSGTPSLPLLTASGTAVYWTTFEATGAANLPALTASGDGVVSTGPQTREATGAATLPLLTVSADASFWSTLTATGESTLPLLTAEGAAARFTGRTGSGAVTLPILTASGAGEIIDLFGGTGSPTLPLLAASGVATRSGTRTGEGAATLPLIVSAGAGLPREPTIFTASVALTLPMLTAEGPGFQRYRDDSNAHTAYDLALIMFDPSDSATVQVTWSGLSVGIASVAYTLPTGLTQVAGGIDNSRDPRITRVRISGAQHGYTYPCTATATLQDGTTSVVRFTIRGFNA